MNAIESKLTYEEEIQEKEYKEDLNVCNILKQYKRMNHLIKHKFKQE